MPDAYPCRVRVTARARRISLRFDPRLGLEVVTPKPLDQDMVDQILHTHRPWIRRQEQRFGVPSGPARDVPARLVLPVAGQDLKVVRGHGRGAIQAIANGGHSLLLAGDTTSTQDCLDALESYVRKQARRHLPPMLRKLAQEHSLGYERVRIGKQKSRWGSCSGKGTISLNMKLLFLPPEQVRYVLLHELAHTVHLNHSPRFWKLLATLEPNARQLDKLVDQGWQHVPTWLA